MAMDEWQAREATCDQFGLPVEAPALQMPDDPKGRVLVVEPDAYTLEKIAHILEAHGHTVLTAASGTQAEGLLAQERALDLVISALYLGDSDGLRLCSQMRSKAQLRRLPVLLVLGQEELGGLVKGFDLGINDYLFRPIDGNELKARVRTQVRRKRYQDGLLDSYQRSLTLALTDTLTGLYNRRYFEAHIEATVTRATGSGKEVSILMLDIDHFKLVNDTHGHDVGDQVLQDVARHLKSSVRASDFVARYGGEEFLVLLPDTSALDAEVVAEKVRRAVAASVHPLVGQVTVSVGVSQWRDDLPDEGLLVRRADQALYAAKGAGRNRVMVWQEGSMPLA